MVLAFATLVLSVASCDSSTKGVASDAGSGGQIGTDAAGPDGGENTGGGGAVAPGGSGGRGGAAGSPGCPPSGANLGIAQHPDEGNNHLVACSATDYQTIPPSSGSHYPSWPAYKTYAQPVPWGYLVHGLEHGAVVVVYNCPGGCPAEVAAVQTWIDALPTDPSCGGEKSRVVLMPDPTLDVRWAASAWAWTLRSCDFDALMFQQFFDEHYARAAEAICRSSVEIDQSATGWCP